VNRLCWTTTLLVVGKDHVGSPLGQVRRHAIACRSLYVAATGCTVHVSMLIGQLSAHNAHIHSGVFKGGLRCDAPPFGQTMKNFLQAYQKVCFFGHFPARTAKLNNV